MGKLLDRKNPATRWELIKAALRVRGSSLSAVARSMGLTRHAIHHVQRKPYPAVQAEISKVLGVRSVDLWPDRYNADGSPIRQRPNAPTSKPQIRGKRRVPGSKSSDPCAASNAMEAVT